jgi:hypothetical protein
MNVYLLLDAVSFVVLCFASAPLSLASVVFGIITIASGRDTLMKKRRIAIWLPAIVGGITSVQATWLLVAQFARDSQAHFSMGFMLIGLTLGIASMGVSFVCFLQSR